VGDVKAQAAEFLVQGLPDGPQQADAGRRGRGDRSARWSASSHNEQPWHYLVATRANPPENERLLSCLVEGNQVWARAAPVLALGCTSLHFILNGKPNAAAEHDLGLASATLTLEATARGLSVHQMIGILPDRAREL
jgi:nitroreductase